MGFQSIIFLFQHEWVAMTAIVLSLYQCVKRSCVLTIENVFTFIQK